MNPEILVLIAAPLTFAFGLAGLHFRWWRPTDAEADETRALIERTTGLVATMSALVLGLLIAQASNFYNTQKAGLELVSARTLQLDAQLGRIGPEAQPARDRLKQMMTDSYERVWHGNAGSARLPSIRVTAADMDIVFRYLNALRATTSDLQKEQVARATDTFSSIGDQRMVMTLQTTNSISTPFMIILLAWNSLVFFGFGLIAHPNLTSVGVLAIGAVSVASAIFLIVELSTPYAGQLRLSPAPVLPVIQAMGR